LNLVRRTASAWKRHGLGGLLRLVPENIAFYWGRLRHGPERERSEFDDQFRIETARVREIGSLDVDVENAKFAVRYQPSPVDLVRSVLAKLGIDYSRFTFIDFGSGKGRVLILASEFPFAKVVGVEFSRELVEIARANIDRVREQDQKVRNIELVCGDMAAYEPPASPLVAYFYNPCGPSVMSAVLDRLRESWLRSPRDLLAIYVHPEHREVFDGSGFWSALDSHKFCCVYRGGGA
jgi:SAM-dependent methyltransferase